MDGCLLRRGFVTACHVDMSWYALSLGAAAVCVLFVLLFSFGGVHGATTYHNV